MDIVLEPREKPILTKSADPGHKWEAGSVLNGTVWQEPDGLIRMLYRATNDVRPYDSGGYVSSIGYAESRDGVEFDGRKVLISPKLPYEGKRPRGPRGLGCEDPRVVRFGDEYFIYYTAVDGIPPHFKIRIALATTTDFDPDNVRRYGIVGPSGSVSKAATLLPETVGGKYVWYFTVGSDTPASTIMYAVFDSLDQVRHPPAGMIAGVLERSEESTVLTAGHTAEREKLVRVRRGPELGAPPVKTDAGWLMLYCNSDHEEQPEWQISAVLLDLKKPWLVIARTPFPLLRPEIRSTDVVPRVAFPSGALVRGSQLYVYYGSGDAEIRLATCDLARLLNYLDENRISRKAPPTVDVAAYADPLEYGSTPGIRIPRPASGSHVSA